MKLLIKNATILHSSSTYHEGVFDIYIQDGVIQKIGKSINVKDAQVIDNEDVFVSIGWLDVGVEVCDPGFEFREDLETVSEAAMAGGYTGIICHPNTSPVIHSKSEVLYLKNNTRNLAVDFYPIGAVSENCEGKEITEMIDMQRAGAVAFSDGKKPIQDNGMMMRALQYVKTFDGVVINHPHDKSVAFGGQVNEGFVSTSLGLKGISHLAENIMVQRDIYLAEYAESKVHIANISTAESVELIRQAKAKGIQVTTSVAALNLAFDDSALEDFNPNFKVLPPLRSQRDIKALKNGLKDGTIDFINSNHTPWHNEGKNLEFLYAEFGAINLESTYGLANKVLRKILSPTQLIEKLTTQNRKVFGIPIPKIEEGQPANLTIFQSSKKWTFSKNNIRSKSKNSPLIGEELYGQILGIVNKGQLKLV